jgi:hypothetical protein
VAKDWSSVPPASYFLIWSLNVSATITLPAASVVMPWGS